jgi:tRNA A-37 threonylcarbamoyl transferase component Bud32
MDGHRRERFGRYEILGELGRGAMGVVYKARDPKINRLVAVKTISLAGQPPEEERDYRERFFREAEAAGRLSHPGIVTVFDVGEEAETRTPYIVMEFVGGPSLEKLLAGDKQQLPLGTSLQLAIELAEALDCAHGQGVVHRDLKPANILLAEDGHAKIADFGVAKLNLANHTLAGRVLGTPAYMSPEQLDGEAVDGRSDLFSLGVILYTTLTGYRPFQGNSALTVSFKVVNRDPVPVTVLNTDLPAGLDYIVARAMAKDRSQRYQCGTEMALDIQELREGREPPSKGKRPGFAVNGDASQTSSAKVVYGMTNRRAVEGSRSNGGGVLSGRAAAEKLMEKMRSKSFAGALLLAGLLLFGLQVGRFIWPQKVTSQVVAVSGKAAPMPFAEEVAPVKASSTATASLPPAPVAAARPLPFVAKASRPQTSLAARASHPPLQTAPTPGPVSIVAATLEIEVEHKFAEAQLSIWVDDQLTYTHALQGADKQRLIAFHHVEVHEFHTMQLPPGKHNLRVRVASTQASYDRAAGIAGEFASGKENMLRINFSKHGEMQLGLQ